MDFSLLFALVVAVAMLPISNAWLEIDAFAHQSSCTSGSYWTWQANEHQCITFYSGYGYSVRFDWNLLNDHKGQVYAASGGPCTAWLGTVWGNGIHSPCWKGYGTRAAQANWFWDPFLTAGESDASTYSARAIESRQARDNATKECDNPVSPVSFTYPSPDGGERKITVPADEGAADKIAALYAANDFAALSKYAEAPARVAK